MAIRSARKFENVHTKKKKKKGMHFARLNTYKMFMQKIGILFSISLLNTSKIAKIYKLAFFNYKLFYSMYRP